MDYGDFYKESIESVTTSDCVEADIAQTVASLLSSAPTGQMKEAALLAAVDRNKCHEAGKALGCSV